MFKYTSAIAAITLSSVLFTGSVAAEKASAEKITCETFLAYDPDVQERVVWWMEGWDDAGDLVDESGEEDFDRPIAAIIIACKATPKESLWQKIKSHF
jgi:hypothetical protein